MISITSLNNLLFDLPFSVINRDAEKDISTFFSKLRDSEFVSGNKKINLISCSIANLDQNKSASWTAVSRSDKFYFYSLNERFSILILSAYFEFRQMLFGVTKPKTEIGNGPTISDANADTNMAIILSKLLIGDTSFRLRYDSNATDWQFGYIAPIRAFSIKLPLLRILKRGITEVDFRNALGTFVKSVNTIEDLPLIRHSSEVGDYDSVFQLTGKKNRAFIKAFSCVRKCFRDRRALTRLKDEIVQGILGWHQSNPGFLINSSSKDKTRSIVESWVESFFPVLLISLVYKSWVEYFPVPCCVWTDGTYRNLGGLIVGYKLNDQISHEERAIFRLISSRITAAASIQQSIDKEASESK